MPVWFYINDGQTLGPFKGAELLELVRTQAVTAETMVRKDESAWFPAGEVGGLFAAAAKPVVEYVCPTCNHSVAKPPCFCRHCRKVIDYARPKLIEHVVEGYENEKSEANQESVSESWKQWVRRLKLQRDARMGGGPPRPQ